MVKTDYMRGLIYSRFRSQTEMAKSLNWSKQRLNSIVNGTKKPTIEEIAVLAESLNKSIEEIARVFLPNQSPNRQHQWTEQKARVKE